MNCQEDNNKIQVADTKGTEARTDITTANAGNNGEDTIFELTQEFTYINMTGVDTDNLPVQEV